MLPQTQRGHHIGRDDGDRVSSGQGGEDGTSFPPSNQDGTARKGSKGPDGAADSGQSMFKFFFEIFMLRIHAFIIIIRAKKRLNMFFSI